MIVILYIKYLLVVGLVKDLNVLYAKRILEEGILLIDGDKVLDA